MNNWTKAAELRKEAAELYKKAKWQASCLANEGKTSVEIDNATAAKIARMTAIDVEISALMCAGVRWSVKMSAIKIAEVRCAIHDKNYQALRDLSRQAKVQGMELCDEQKLTTIALCMLECSLFAGTSPGHTRQLDAMLDAIERGNHPYDDTQAKATFEADAAIAQAQLDAIVGRRG